MISVKKLPSPSLQAILLALLCAVATSAEPVVLTSPSVELVISEEATIVSRHDNGWETKMVVEQDGQRVRISWKQDQAVLLFPTTSLRVKTEEKHKERKVTTYLNEAKYLITETPREVSWKLPGQDVFFRKRGGRISQAMGTADYLKLYRNTPGGRVTLQSSAGKTDALLNDKGELETFDGPEVGEHVYLVRGLALKKGPVTLRYRLPSGPFLDGLPADRFLTINQPVKPLPEPAAREPETRPEDPLQAKPATWSSPELNANSGKREEDPLNARREKIVKHPEDPLRAKTSKNSEELLRVKDY